MEYQISGKREILKKKTIKAENSYEAAKLFKKQNPKFLTNMEVSGGDFSTSVGVYSWCENCENPIFDIELCHWDSEFEQSICEKCWEGLKNE